MIEADSSINKEGSIIDGTVQDLEAYINKSKVRMITAASNNNRKTTFTKSSKQKWEEKQLCGFLKSLTYEIAHEII